MGIVDDLADMFPDTVVMETLGTGDRYGAKTVTASVSIKAYVSGRETKVRDAQGQMRSSSVHATLAGCYGATPNHQFTLPDRFNPRSPAVIAVMKSTDEDGPHHETVYFV